MTENVLKEYFEGMATVDQLALDLKDSQKKTGYDVTTVYVDRIENGNFEIKKEHLIRLFDDFIEGRLSPLDMTTVSFALIASDFFCWDSDTDEGEIIADVIFQLDDLELGYDTSLNSILLWKEYLLTGKIG